MPRNLIIGLGNKSSTLKDDNSDTEWFSDEGSDNEAIEAPATIINNANPLQAEEVNQTVIAPSTPVLEAQIPEPPQATSRTDAWNLITNLREQIKELDKSIKKLENQHFDAVVLLEDNATWDAEDEAQLQDERSHRSMLQSHLENVLNQKHSRAIRILRRL